MIYQKTKDKIEALSNQFRKLKDKNFEAVRAIALSEISETVYNSNAIENSTLSLEDTEDIIIRNQIKKDYDVREIYEAKNLAEITEIILNNPAQKLNIELILKLHKILLTGIENDYAGRFRGRKEWVQVGNHLGANPAFVPELTSELINTYNKSKKYFLENIAYFHAEFETIHPFCDGNGRMGRIIINKQLIKLDLPPIIIRGKSKRSDYYPQFDIYGANDDFGGFTDLFALLLIEALNKYNTLIVAKKVIPLKDWSKAHKVKANIALNKAKRQTIPAFRLREKWHISEDFEYDGE
jgi:Fic family protein